MVSFLSVIDSYAQKTEVLLLALSVVYREGSLIYCGQYSWGHKAVCPPNDP